MITKELLSEVLGKSVVGDIESPFPEYIYYDWDFKDNTMRINIYELAHKCKEWALSNKLFLSSELLGDGGGVCYAYKKLSSNSPVCSCTSHTEPEAIISVCQWILDSKGK